MDIGSGSWRDCDRGTIGNRDHNRGINGNRDYTSGRGIFFHGVKFLRLCICRGLMGWQQIGGAVIVERDAENWSDNLQRKT